MRLTGGEARGRTLQGPRDDRIRPTSDKVRAAIFNILDARYSVADRLVLDLFAGTGALGLEALSRAARGVTFVDASSAACSLIQRNLERSGYGERAEVIRGRLPDALDRIAPGYGGVFIDPPYRSGLALAALERLARGNLLANRAWAVVEHEPKGGLPETIGRLERRVEKRYGDTALSIFEVVEAA